MDWVSSALGVTVFDRKEQDRTETGKKILYFVQKLFKERHGGPSHVKAAKRRSSGRGPGSHGSVGGVPAATSAADRTCGGGGGGADLGAGFHSPPSPGTTPGPPIVQGPQQMVAAPGAQQVEGIQPAAGRPAAAAGGPVSLAALAARQVAPPLHLLSFLQGRQVNRGWQWQQVLYASCSPFYKE
jgi:hypothetical protein